MNEIILLTAGLICGFFSSSPLGSINFWLIDQTLHHKKNILPFLLGVVSADLTYAALAAWGNHSLFSDPVVDKWVAGIGAVFLITLGIFSLKTKPKTAGRTPKKQPEKAEVWPFKKFLLGAFMCGSNPAFLLFWIFAMNTLENKLTIDFTGLSFGFFLAGIALGDLAWFATLIALVRKLREKIKGNCSVLISRAVAFVFIAIGSYGILTLVTS